MRALVQSPTAYIDTLRFALRRGRSNPRRTLWQLFYFAEAMILWHHLDKRDIRHIHAHFANVGTDVARLAATYGRKRGQAYTWSFTMHGPAEFLDIKGTGLADKVRNADFIICISDYCRSQLMWLVDQNEWSKMAVVHCGVEVPAAVIRPVRNDGSVRVLTVGRLTPVKGHSLLLETVAGLQSRGVNVQLRVVGNGPMQTALKERAAQLNIEDRVRWLGAVGQDDISEHYDWADVFCLPSVMEGVPVVLMEAMSKGLPVIATEITGVPELIENNRSGLLVRPGRSDLLGEAITRLTSDAELATALTNGARQQIIDHFDLVKNANALAQIFKQKLTTDEPNLSA